MTFFLILDLEYILFILFYQDHGILVDVEGKLVSQQTNIMELILKSR
jgi:hypothetical protein